MDSSHPMRPGDARRFPIAVSDCGDTTSRPDFWYVREGAVFCADTLGHETVRFDSVGTNWITSPARTTILRNGTEIAHLEFRGLRGTRPDSFPSAAFRGARPDAHAPVHPLAPGQVHFTEIVPHVFTIDLDSLNTRITSAKFTDSLLVREGATNALDTCEAAK